MMVMYKMRAAAQPFGKKRGEWPLAIILSPLRGWSRWDDRINRPYTLPHPMIRITLWGWAHWYDIQGK